ncbi:MAG: hypothetical protein Q7S60_04880 [bacterium]|nr:hypothetical protein [bacterium]
MNNQERETQSAVTDETRAARAPGDKIVVPYIRVSGGDHPPRHDCEFGGMDVHVWGSFKGREARRKMAHEIRNVARDIVAEEGQDGSVSSEVQKVIDQAKRVLASRTPLDVLEFVDFKPEPKP